MKDKTKGIQALLLNETQTVSSKGMSHTVMHFVKNRKESLNFTQGELNGNGLSVKGLVFRDYSSVTKIAAGTASVPQMFCVLCGWGVFRGGRVWSFSGQRIICDGRSPHDSPLTRPLTPNTSHTVLPRMNC